MLTVHAYITETSSNIVFKQVMVRH